jgi:hypothetical protein
MRRYLGRFILALLALFLLSAKFVDVTVGANFGNHPAETAWMATGLLADRFTMDYWVKAPAGTGRQDARALAEHIGARLGVGKRTIFAGEAQGIRYANLDGSLGAEGEMILTIQAEKTVTHIGVSYNYPNLPKSLSAIERRVRSSLAGYGPRGEIYWTVRGRQRGRLRDDAWRTMWARVLTSVAAVRRGDKPGDAVIEAYSPLIPANGDNINLVMASDYDPASGMTTVYLASPTLGEEI